MVILIGGATHTGKTLLARKLVEARPYFCLSIDHLKMGLIRSGQTKLTPVDDEKLMDYLWPIVREIVRTALENGQDLILEGAYIPADWYESFAEAERSNIRCRFLVMKEEYIRSHFSDICAHACDIEQRLDPEVNMEDLIRENRLLLNSCRPEDCIVLDREYRIDPELFWN